MPDTPSVPARPTANPVVRNGQSMAELMNLMRATFSMTGIVRDAGRYSGKGDGREWTTISCRIECLGEEFKVKLDEPLLTQVMIGSVMRITGAIKTSQYGTSFVGERVEGFNA